MFTTLDKDTLETLGFTVGEKTAIRVRFGTCYILHYSGLYFAQHRPNNVSLIGKSRDPVLAYRAAKEALLLKMRELGAKDA